MADVFISYASEDRDRVKPVIEALEDAGFSVWWDRRIGLGASFDKAIEAELNAAKAVVVVWSYSSVESDWVRNEADEGLQRGALVPVCIDDVRPPLAFRRAQTADFKSWPPDPADFESVLSRVNELVAGNRPAFSPPDQTKVSESRSKISPVAWAVGGFLLAAAIVFIVRSVGPELITDPPERTAAKATERTLIVVLPFVNLSGDPEQDVFADGMTDEMINVLSNTQPDSLGVIARYSAMLYKHRAATIETIASELNVDYVVGGTVRRRGEEVRISATLVQVSDQSQIWSGNFTDSIADVITLQNRLATQIASALAINLLPDEAPARRTRKPLPDAYDAYLNGRFWSHKGTGEGWMKAITGFEEATRIDPEFAAAHAALADAYANDAVWRGISGSEIHRKASNAARTALRLNPELSEAHAAEAIIKLFFEWDWRGAEAAFQQALRLNPTNGQMLHHFGHYLDFMGRHEEALRAFSEAQSLDPLSAFHHNGEAYTLINMGELEQAERVFDRVRELDANLPVSWYTLGMLRERQGRLVDAMAAWEKAAQLSPQRFYIGALGYAYARNGLKERAENVIRRLQDEWPEATTAMDQAKVHTGLGELDRSFELLEVAIADREPWIMGVGIDPGFAPLRQEARYQQFIRRLNEERLSD